MILIYLLISYLLTLTYKFYLWLFTYKLSEYENPSLIDVMLCLSDLPDSLFILKLTNESEFFLHHWSHSHLLYNSKPCNLNFFIFLDCVEKR